MIINNYESKLDVLRDNSDKYVKLDKLSELLDISREDIELLINSPLFKAFYRRESIPDEINERTFIDTNELLKVLENAKDVAIQKVLLRDAFIMNDAQFMEKYQRPRDLFANNKNILVQVED